MKKIVCSFFSLLFSLFIFSQQTLFEVNNSESSLFLENKPGVDFICIINGISISTELKYLPVGSDINWYRFSNPTASISNINSISPEDATGYILKVDGQEKTIWVFDYQNYILKTENESFNIEESSDECEQVELKFSGEIKPMIYQNKNGDTSPLHRHFTVNYLTQKWNGDKWQEEEASEIFIFPSIDATLVKSPLKDTEFSFSGDQFAKELLSNPLPSVSSTLLSATALECHITTSVIVREEKNEIERPKEIRQVSGSAPLDINFKSNSNNPQNSFFSWSIYKNQDLLLKRSEEEHLYTFSEPGKYKIQLQITNSAGCASADSIEVVISESSLKVPNVFTPNGDGKNDEFRVAYRSLESFHCRVYDSWGSLVFEWNNPAKGWDGRIRGKNAPIGTYFYIIKAKGTDGIVYNLKGDINILR